MGKIKDKLKNATKEVGKEMGAEGGAKILGGAAGKLAGGASEGAKKGAEEFVREKISRERLLEESRVKIWLSILRNREIKEGMTPEKAAKKLQKIQDEYKNSKKKPYYSYKDEDGNPVYERYGETEEDRLNKALGLFAMHMDKEELNEFQMQLASMSRKEFDGFIETVLEDSVHRWINFIKQFLNLSYDGVKKVLGDAWNVLNDTLNATVEELTGTEPDNPIEATKILLENGLVVGDEVTGSVLKEVAGLIDQVTAQIRGKVPPRRGRHERRS